MPRKTGLLKLLAAIVGLAALLLCLLIEAPDGLDPRGFRAIGVTCLVAAFWLFEIMPIPITSLLPILLFPLLGIMPSDRVAAAYAGDLTFLFLGGFFMALVIERWGLHRRIALRIVGVFGVRPERLILGVMVAVALLSMWISNTATTLMMLPICIALADEVEGGDQRSLGLFATALLLGVAYAANVGGMGTPIGTPPNGIFLREFAGSRQPSFLQWIVFTMPLVVVFLVLIHLILTRLLFRFGAAVRIGDRDLIAARLRDLGPMKPQERWTALIFGLVVALWIFRRDFELGSLRIPGWVSGLEALGMTGLAGGARKGLGDSAVAIFGVLVFSLVRPGPERRPLADWEMTRRLPWGLLLLLGGGFAIAEAFDVGGDHSLAAYIAGRFAALTDLSQYLLVPLVCLVMTFVTEVTSNTATTNVVVPILAGLGSPELSRNLGLAATLSASCAFMLPVATPPNAIVFGSGRLRMMDMVRAGLLINLLGVILVTLTVLLIAVNVMPRP
ncbi:MAG: SLC13/DASS family transporter [Planctomycetes bacterium]|nr:SLC13/DASS family transporter [Planctomycetota bacterium]